jgi:hypothetical protein
VPTGKATFEVVKGESNLGGALNVAGRSEFNSTTVLPNQTEATLCNSSNEGAARYNNATKTLEVCDGANWGSTYPRGTLAGWCLLGIAYWWPSTNTSCHCASGWMLVGVEPPPLLGFSIGGVWACMKE